MSDLTLPEEVIFTDHLRFRNHLPSVHTMLQRLKLMNVSDPFLCSSAMLSDDVIFRYTIFILIWHPIIMQCQNMWKLGLMSLNNCNEMNLNGHKGRKWLFWLSRWVGGLTPPSFISCIGTVLRTVLFQTEILMSQKTLQRCSKRRRYWMRRWYKMCFFSSF